MPAPIAASGSAISRPPDCPVCTDMRNDLPEDGWHFLPEAEVAATHDGAVRAGRRRPVGLHHHAPSGAGRHRLADRARRRQHRVRGRALLFARDAGADRARSAASAFSPPATRTAMARCSSSSASSRPRLLAIHKDDLRHDQGVPRHRARMTTCWSSRPATRCIIVGGHYEGQAALHDAPGRRLFCGDMFKIDQDAAGRSPRDLQPQGVPQGHPADARRAPPLPRGHRPARVRRGADPVRICPRGRTATSRWRRSTRR